MKYKAKDYTRFGIMISLSLAISVAESWLIPAVLFPVPGMRLGLANVVTLVSLYFFGIAPTLMIVVSRCILTFAFGGNLVAFLFSLLGGLCSLAVMHFLISRRHYSVFGVSVGGAAAHNVGQILAAVILTRTIDMVAYLPVLLIVSLLTGSVIAIAFIPIYRACTIADKNRGRDLY